MGSRLSMQSIVGGLLAVALITTGIVTWLVPSRAEQLDRWLRGQGQRVLRPSERADYGQRLATILARETKAFAVNPSKMGRGRLTIVVYSSVIPGVVANGALNAAYDRRLDAIFIDKALLSPRISDDLLRFILLHEIGHRTLHHKGLAHLTSVPGGRRNAFSHRQELEADQFALQRYMADIGLTPAAAAERLDETVEDDLLGSFLLANQISAARDSASHPALVDRAFAVFEALAALKELTPDERKRQFLLAAWTKQLLDDTRRHLIGEVIAPGEAPFARGASAPWGALLLLGDGRMAKVKLTQMGGRLDLQSSIVGGAFPTPIWIAELNSGSQFWYNRGAAYLLRSAGRLYVAAERNGWRWEAPTVLAELKGSALSIDHRPGNTQCPTVVASKGDHMLLFRLAGSAKSLRLVSVADLPWTVRERGQEGVLRYAGAANDVIGFFASLGGNENGVLVLYRVHISCNGGPAQIERILVEQAGRSVHAAALIDGGKGWALISRPESWHDVQISITTAQGVQVRSLSVPTYLKAAMAKVPLSAKDNAFNGGVGTFAEIAPGILQSNIDSVGTFLIETRSGKMLVGGGGARVAYLSTPVSGPEPVLATPATRAARMYLWRTSTGEER